MEGRAATHVAGTADDGAAADAASGTGAAAETAGGMGTAVELASGPGCSTATLVARAA